MNSFMTALESDFL